MPWEQTPEFTINSPNLIRFGLGGSVPINNVGVFLRDVPAFAYERFGYVWATSPLTVGAASYDTEIDGGPIWGRAYRYQLIATFFVTTLNFKPTRNVPAGCRARLLYFRI